MKYKKNSIVTGKITGIKDYGMFVSLNEYYNGLIHVSEISNDFVKNIGDYGKIGEMIRVKILDIDESNYQMKLSIKDINYKINKKIRKPIVETGSGFLELKDNLEKWIKEKNSKKG